METKELRPGDKQKFQGNTKVAPEVFEYYKDRVEKEFIIKSLSELPVEKLKQLVDFEAINPFDNSIPKSMEDEEHRWQLREEGVVEFRMEILI